jgi:glycine cleavage system H protein
MDIPEDRRYTREHEWAKTGEDGLVRVGITDYAQEALGDVVYVQLPDVGATVEADAVFGEIESTKSVSDLYSPVGGEVVDVNSVLEDAPEKVNADPYGDGWIVVLRPTDPTSVDGLMDAAAYRAYLAEADA